MLAYDRLRSAARLLGTGGGMVPGKWPDRCLPDLQRFLADSRASTHFQRSGCLPRAAGSANARSDKAEEALRNVVGAKASKKSWAGGGLDFRRWAFVLLPLAQG